MLYASLPPRALLVLCFHHMCPLFRLIAVSMLQSLCIRFLHRTLVRTHLVSSRVFTHDLFVHRVKAQLPRVLSIVLHLAHAGAVAPMLRSLDNNTNMLLMMTCTCLSPLSVVVLPVVHASKGSRCSRDGAEGFVDKSNDRADACEPSAVAAPRIVRAVDCRTLPRELWHEMCARWGAEPLLGNSGTRCARSGVPRSS